MKLPDGHEVNPNDFRELLRTNREAQMMASAVLKSQPFGSAPLSRAEIDGRPVLVIGEQQDRATAEREQRKPLWKRVLGWRRSLGE